MSWERDANWKLNQQEFAERAVTLYSDPVRIILSPTDLCNVNPRCVMCLTAPHQQAILSSAAIIAVTPFLQTVKFLTFSSLGEPFFARSMIELLDIVDENCSIEIQTNGLILPKRVRQAIIGKVAKLFISIDAATLETYDAIRMPGKWERLMQNLRDLRTERDAVSTCNPQMRLDFVVMRRNVEEMVDFVGLAAEMGAYGVKFTPMLSISHEHRQERPDFHFDYAEQYLAETDLVYQERITHCRELCRERQLTLE
jgi:MoaA/NifB/PqqE/SkfB family radical SAM enzyme